MAVLGVKYIQNTTTLHRGSPQALPGFQADFLVFGIHAGAEEQREKPSPACPLRTGAQAGEARCARSRAELATARTWRARGALAAREEAMPEQSSPAGVRCPSLSTPLGRKAAAPSPFPGARVWLAGNQSRPFLPRRDPNNLFPPQPPSLPAGAISRSNPLLSLLLGRGEVLPPPRAPPAHAGELPLRLLCPGAAGADEA